MGQHANPVIAENCPDPAIFRDGESGDLVVACTSNLNDDGAKFPLRRSADLRTWRPIGHIFPAGAWPAWATRDFWAPEIHRVGDAWVCYYTARDRTGLLCIGAARAQRLEGPWQDLGRPLLRDERVGLIDAHLLQDGGRRYLYWKEDGNGAVPPLPSVLCVQEVAADGMTPAGPRVELFANDLPWEGDVVEGPWVVAHGGGYVMFYAANTFNSPRYATGVARAASPLGPFEKKGDPILVSSERWHGPGHGSVVTIDGEDWFAYHAWEAGRIDEVWDQSVHPRMMLLDRITWADGWPRIADGTPSG
ncbi:MAG TPA: glycoside hydrolase family 43 protein [Kofleriaceae bacterium]|nr:glycoside hydrolase family 43 protein [Kofleriaceae bacterium]